MESLLQDVRYGFRMLMRTPSVTIVVILILAVGIGISSALFSVIDGAFLHPFIYRNNDRLVVLTQKFPRKNLNTYLHSIPEYLDLRSLKPVFEDVVAMRPLSLNLADNLNPERIAGTRVTSNLFPIVGLQPILGRTFLPEEDKPGGEKVVIMTYRLWERHYMSDPRIVGQTIVLDDERYTVIGVLPRRFYWWGADVLLPMGMNEAVTDRSSRSLYVAAWIKEGVSDEMVSAQLEGLARRLDNEEGGATPEYNGLQIAYQVIRDVVIKDLKPALMILLGAVGLILLLSCANVGNLRLAQASARQKEITMCMALGATRVRIIRQLLTESILLSIIGGALGFLLARYSLTALVSLIPPSYIAEEAEIRANPTVFIFSMLVTLLMGVLFGIIPALQSSQHNISDSLKEGSQRAVGDRRGRRIRTVLVIAEISLALVILVGAALMIRSYNQITAINLGFNPNNVLTMRVTLPEARYREGQQVASFFRDALDGIQTLPGVESAAIVSNRPMTEIAAQDLTIEGRGLQEAGGLANAEYRVISPNYFSVMRIPLLKGRFFTDQDKADSLPVAMINETMANSFWPNEDPIGKHFKLGGVYSGMGAAHDVSSDSPTLTIVGVVADAKQRRDVLLRIKEEFYMPHLQRADRARSMALIVRTTADPASLTGMVRQRLSRVDIQQPVYEIMTLDEIVARGSGPRRMAVVLLTMFATVALVLATVGLYTIIAYSVNQRRTEIGIRMALGAQQSDVLRMIIKQGLSLLLFGLLVGIAITLILTRLMSSLLYGVSATDPATLAAISLLLMVIGLMASYIPARRATRIDPAIALRYE